MTARTRTAALVAVLLAVLLGSSQLTPAQALPYTGAATLGVSQSSPCQHGSITLSGSGYVAGSSVELEIGTVVLGRVTVGADGTFSLRVTLPARLSGPQTITATSTSGARSAATRITIRDCSASGTPSDGAGAGGAGAGSGNSGGGLSATGVAVLTLLVVAVVLIGAGLVLVFGGRRRRPSRGTA